MTVNIKGIDYELKYTYNSFRYMELFDLSALNEIDSKPFKTIGIAEDLLIGAVNSDPKNKVSLLDVQEYIASIVDSDDGDIVSLIEEMVVALQESNFFKQLQKTPTTKPKKAKK